MTKGQILGILVWSLGLISIVPTIMFASFCFADVTNGVPVTILHLNSKLVFWSMMFFTMCGAISCSIGSVYLRNSRLK